MGNFEFLRVYWPTLSEMGKVAEIYVYTDPNSCIYKLGQMSELMVRDVLSIEQIPVSQSNTHQNNIEILKRTGLISDEVNDYLFSIRKARNTAVHSGIQSQEKAMTLLKMTFSLMSWFMEVYGDWSFEVKEFEIPLQLKDEYEVIKERIEKQELVINDLLFKIEEVRTAASDISILEKVEKVKELNNHLQTDESIELYLEEEKVRIEVSILPSINYGLQQNGISFIRNLTVINNRDDDLEDITLNVSTYPNYIERIDHQIRFLPSKSVLDLSNIKLQIDADKLIQLTEKEKVVLTISLSHRDKTIYEENLDMFALTFDQWQGINFMPELLVTYIMPNHPDVSKIMTKASDVLKEWGEDSSLEGYQSKSIKRVRDQIAAVFAAIKSLNLVYTNPPASFEVMGQRIRLIDQIFEERIGTCLDLTLFMSSVLEAIGINPILITQPGHIFLGAWLEDLTFPEIVEQDVTIINKRVAKGVNEIILIESTLLTSSSNSSFDDAIRSALVSLEINELDCVIDVKRARLTNVLPLPTRVSNQDGIRSIVQERVYSGKVSPSEYQVEQIVAENFEDSELTKIDQWEKRLLDLTLRNNLINMKLTRGIIPFFANSLDQLEDALSNGQVFSINPKPAEWHIRQEDSSFENSNDLGNFEEMIKSEMNSKRLRAFLTDVDLDNRLKNLYRTARLSFEENGANTLFMTFGLMKWYESNKSESARYAPVILVPIELKRRAASHSYTVRIRDEESQMNITLLEKIKQEFGIEIKGLNPLPMDKEGIDIRKVFTIIRKAIKNQSRWDLIESNFIGNFSFSQFVMWNDLRNRTKDLKKNKIVNSLIESKLTFEPEYASNLDYEEIENTVLQPLSADASQLVAIQNSIEGKSFVLHGPPGTGKSQTITSLIANNLFRGRTVLFVAEKMAALEVVQKRLVGIGLGDFALELHSNKANKKDILNYFENVINLVNMKSVESFSDKSEEIATLRTELNTYSKELHKVRSNDFSIYELISEYEENKSVQDIEKFEVNDLKDFNKEIKKKHEQFIVQLIDVAQQIGHPHNHALSFVTLTEYSQSLREEVKDILEIYRVRLNNLIDSYEKLEKALYYNIDSSRTGIELLDTLIETLLNWESLPVHWKIEENLNFKLHNIKNLAEETIKRDNVKAELLMDWDEEFLKLNGSQLNSEVSLAQNKWFVAKFFSMRKIRKSISLVYNDSKLDEMIIVRDIRKLKELQDQETKVSELFSNHGSYLRDEYRGKDTNWNRIIEMINAAISSSDLMKELTGSHEFRIKNADKIDIYPKIKSFRENLSIFMETYTELDSLLLIRGYTDEEWLQHLVSLDKNIEDNLMMLKEWVLWNEMKKTAHEMKLTNLINAYEEDTKHQEVMSIYRKNFSLQLSSFMITEIDTLNKFNGILFNSKIDQFIKVDQEISELSKVELRYKILSNLPDFRLAPIGKSEIAILKRAIASKGRAMTIRKLFSEIPNLLPKLAPVMLMSPISAAQYLDPSHPQFDLVVFDEASQLPTAKAVGTIARAKDTIIVGDPKQMPPTSFFSSNRVDEDNVELEDLESVLDDAIAISLPESHLQWHYRSKHESLINFSNGEFYRNGLYTFPSSNDMETKVSLKYVGGTFDRARRRHNLVEANAIVDYLYKLYKNKERNYYSVGIVTFNSNQQSLVEDLIVERSVKDPEFDNWVNKAEEPVFIKNLENVQGDERDIILFSIGYGPDQEGKVYMNFGPLNRQGGWRRLNVAITRSRYEMIVFSSLYPEDIDLNKTSADGVAALKKFLQYASSSSNIQRFSESDLAINKKQHNNGIAKAIANVFTGKGYDVALSIGKSSFKVDVGILDKENPKEYLVGILLDGYSYQSAKTTRDREVSHRTVLEMLNWNIIRVWSMDWRENPEKEINRIEQFIKDLKTCGRPRTLSSKVVESTIVLKEVDRNNDYSALSYKSHKIIRKELSIDELVSSLMVSTMKKTIKDLVEIESPIYRDVAYRKVANGFGVTRLTQRVIRYLNGISTNIGLHIEKEGERQVFWFEIESINDRTIFRKNTEEEIRHFTDIPLREISNAMRYILESYISLNKEDLIRESAHLLGTRTVSSVVRKQAELAVKYSIKNKLIQLTSEGTYKVMDV